jgi:hypothetical protein
MYLLSTTIVCLIEEEREGGQRDGARGGRIITMVRFR